MPYCAYCAAAIDSTQVACLKCGRPTGVAPPPVAANDRPSSVVLGVSLLAISTGLGILSLAVSLLTRGMIGGFTAFYLLRSAGVSALWIVLIVCLWQRQAWARIAVALLLLWNIGNMFVTATRIGGGVVLVAALGVPVLINAMRIIGIGVLFKAESSAWFRK